VTLSNELVLRNFCEYCKTSITRNNNDKAQALKQSYLTLQSSNCVMPTIETHKFDTELVSNIISDLKRGKAVDVDGLTVEHLQFL